MPLLTPSVILDELSQLRARVAELEAELLKYTQCWHCHDSLLEEDPYHCEACPAWHCCSDIECTAPGCEEDVARYTPPEFPRI